MCRAGYTGRIEVLRLRILSDLHLECGLPDLPDVEADVVVLAGDTAEGTRGIQWALSRFHNTPVLYVAGNHEYYGHTFPNQLDELRQAADGSTLHVLERNVVVIGGVEFLGCTLWTGQNLWKNVDTCAAYLEQDLNDYHQILFMLARTETAMGANRKVENMGSRLSGARAVPERCQSGARAVPEQCQSSVQFWRKQKGGTHGSRLSPRWRAIGVSHKQAQEQG